MSSPGMRLLRANRYDLADRGRAQSLMPSAQRERGLWSFLTWSFFVSQLVTAGSFFGSPARAAGEADPTPTSTDPSTAQASGGPLQAAAAIHANAAEDVTSAQASADRAGTQQPSDDHASAPKTINGLAEHGGNHGGGSATVAPVGNVNADRADEATSGLNSEHERPRKPARRIGEHAPGGAHWRPGRAAGACHRWRGCPGCRDCRYPSHVAGYCPRRYGCADHRHQSSDR